MDKIRVGVVGSAGYTGGELLRLLLIHPEVEVVFAHSISQVGNKIYSVHPDLFGDTDLVFTDKLTPNVDVLFLCSAHGDSKIFLENNILSPDIKIIDLSQDFRLLSSKSNFVYGLPELYKKQISKAQFVANPGCFATAIELGLLPLALAGQLDKPVYINAITGSTGAGQKTTDSTHFSWRSNNVSTYKSFEHQHLNEIQQSLEYVQPGFKHQIKMIPIRGDFPRGIFATIALESDLDLHTLHDLYTDFYKQAPFTYLSHQAIDLKQVINTNKCFIHIQKKQNDLLLTVALDNLLKGASGQAVQNMNLMFNLKEETGLKLKASAF